MLTIRLAWGWQEDIVIADMIPKHFELFHDLSGKCLLAMHIEEAQKAIVISLSSKKEDMLKVSLVLSEGKAKLIQCISLVQETS